MGLKIAIHQPNFFPRLKVLQKLANADVWCVLDSVQYCTREWQNRSIIVPTHGENNSFYLSMPVSKLNEPKSRDSKISEMIIMDPNYLGYIEKTLYYAYRHAKYWDSIDKLIANIKTYPNTNKLTDICVETTNSLLQIADKKPALIYSSELSVTGKSSNLISNLCKYFGSDIYLTDSGSYNYLKPNHFDEIDVLWQNWIEPMEKCNNINSWRNISSLNYLSRFGPEIFARHLLHAEFKVDLKWLSQ